MKKAWALAAPLLVFAAPAGAMNVQIFLNKAERLEKRGPLAIFSSDLKLLMNQVQSDMTALKAEKDKADAAHHPAAFCPPKNQKINMTEKDILAAMRAVPAPRRATTDTRDALRAYFARRFPCPA